MPKGFGGKEGKEGSKERRKKVITVLSNTLYMSRGYQKQLLLLVVIKSNFYYCQ
jgi:hypothetical protein